MLFAASCKDSEEYLTSAQQQEDAKYTILPYSITASISPMTDKVDSLELKTTFIEGDAIIITNSQILAVPAILTSDGCAGKEKALFTGELKIKINANLESGTTKLTAALKNTLSSDTLYNNGHPFLDVKEIKSFTQALDRYSYWACEDFTYNSNETSISLNQKTLFVELYELADGTTVKTNIDRAYSSNAVEGDTVLFAMPYGITCFGKTLEEEGKVFYLLQGVPENCLPGLFTVGEGRRVRFSKGNLQYNPGDSQWRIAPLQYHTCFDPYQSYYVGDNHSELSADMWIDLFGFGTWTNNGYPTSTDYYAYLYNASINFTNSNLDENCAIGKEWDMLSYPEWYYLLHTRNNAKEKVAYAKIDNIAGIVLLPDNWETPQNLDFKAYDWNSYTTAEWMLMESNGAVFLPTTGTRIGETVRASDQESNQYTTKYWTKTAQDYNKYEIVLFGGEGTDIGFDLDSNFAGHPVRLISRFDATNNYYNNYCYALKTNECHTISNQEWQFWIITNGFTQGQCYELTMLAKSDIENFHTPSSILETTPKSPEDDGICSLNPDGTDSYYFSNKWHEIHLTGTFDHDGRCIALNISPDIKRNNYYIDDICLKIDGAYVLTNDCSSYQDLEIFIWKRKAEKNTCIIELLDKENTLPTVSGSNKPQPGTIVYEANDIVVDPSQPAYYTDDFATIIHNRYSVIMEVRSDEESYFIANFNGSNDINAYLSNFTEVGTEWQTIELTFDNLPVNDDLCNISLSNNSTTPIYIRNLKVVYQGN